MEMISSIDVNLTKIDERQMTLMTSIDVKWLELTSIDVKIFDASVMTLYDVDDVFWHFVTFYDLFWRFQYLKKFEKKFLTIFDDFMTFYDVDVNFGHVNWRHLTSIDVKYRQTSIWRQLMAFDVRKLPTASKIVIYFNTLKIIIILNIFYKTFLFMIPNWYSKFFLFY